MTPLAAFSRLSFAASMQTTRTFSAALLFRSSSSTASPAAANASPGTSTPPINTPFPPIKTIPYSSELMRMANDIQVTGKLGADLKVYNTPAGMVGRMPIYVSTRPNQPDLLYTIEASEGLGPLIDEQLKNCKGAIVNVVGRLRVDPYVDNKTGASRHLLVIEAEQLSVLEGTLELVRRTSSTPSKGQAPPAPATAPAAASPRSASSPPRISSQVQPSGSSKAAGGQSAVTPPGERMTPEREAELWELFSQNRNEFWDNSEKGPMPKKNPKGPDFKNKKTGEALWISSRNAPDWVREL